MMSRSIVDARGEAVMIADRLHSAAIHLLRRLRREDDASGLSAPRLSALSVVVFGGPITLGALAAAEQVRPPTMTRLVQALEREGLVVRRTQKGDARIVVIRATPRGTRLLTEGRMRRVMRLARDLDALKGAELQLLSRAVKVLERVVRPHPHGGDRDYHEVQRSRVTATRPARTTPPRRETRANAIQDRGLRPPGRL